MVLAVSMVGGLIGSILSSLHEVSLTFNDKPQVEGGYLMMVIIVQLVELMGLILVEH